MGADVPPKRPELADGVEPNKPVPVEVPAAAGFPNKLVVPVVLVLAVLFPNRPPVELDCAVLFPNNPVPVDEVVVPGAAVFVPNKFVPVEAGLASAEADAFPKRPVPVAAGLAPNKPPEG